jgi:hypothetical protein
MISLDYVIIQKGSLVLTLDNSTRVQLGQDDFVIQQARMHGWDNEINEWTQMLGIVLPARAPVANGKELAEALGELFGPPDTVADPENA